MKTPDTSKIAEDFADAVDQWSRGTDRSVQSDMGQVGPSDVGFCHEQVRWKVTHATKSDTPSLHKAFIGSWLGEGYEAAIKGKFGGFRTQVSTTVKLPSGLVLPAHPDIVTPKMVLDIKTVDGLTSVKRNGASEAQRFQRQLYAGGLVQNEILPPDCWVGNMWFDRSGRDRLPHVEVEPYDESWLERADQWLEDVWYAIKQGERAMQDQPLNVCEAVCEWFSICRMDDVRKDRESGGLIDEPEQVDLVAAYIEGREIEKQGAKMKEDAKRGLADVSGSTGTHIVKWTWINPTEIPGSTRDGHHKLDVRKIPAPKRKK